jgi:hypothetical protein
MPGLFTITTPRNTLDLDDKRQAEAAFTVTNTSDQFLRGRAILVTEDPAVMPWLTLTGSAERDFAVAGTEAYLVTVKVPEGVVAGNYVFRLDMVNTANPDENRETGPSVIIKVPAIKPPPPPIPWIPIAIGAGVLLLVVIGVIIFFATRSPDANFGGSWNLNFGTMQLTQNGSDVTGTFADQLGNRTGEVKGTVSKTVFTGTWSLAGLPPNPLGMTIDEGAHTITGTAINLVGTEPGSWCGAQGAAAFPPGCSFAGVWQTSLDGTPFTMTLTLKMPNVSGTYELAQGPQAGGSITGTVQFNGPMTVLNGGYTVVPVGTPTARTGTVQFFLNGYNALQFQGNWRESAARAGAWCGQRAGQAEPNPCRR